MGLLKEGEEIGDLQKLTVEEILKRWMNWQLVRIINTKSINLKDCENLFHLLKEGDGQLLIKLCAVIDAPIINWELVGTTGSDEDKENNAKYAISIARKLGAI